MKDHDIDTSFIADALPAFLSEAREQVESIEQLLLELEDTPEDRGLLDALFRCAHTVKGSAGIFGLDAVVGFTHHVETLLDRLREGQLSLSPELSTLLLQCNDQIKALVDAAQDTGGGEAEGADARAALVARLQAFGHAPGPVDAAAAAETPPAAEPQPARWHLAARFGAETFRNGMDPLTILRYVAGLGTIPHVSCNTASVPTLDELDPEQCHLGFDIALETEEPREAIEAAFSFVRDDCQLVITPPPPTSQGSGRRCRAWATSWSTSASSRPRSWAWRCSDRTSRGGRPARHRRWVTSCRRTTA